MRSKNYVLASFCLLAIIVVDYFINFIKYGSNPAEFLITSDFALVVAILSLALAVISVYKGNKWGWLAIGLCFLPLILGAVIYFALSTGKF